MNETMSRRVRLWRAAGAWALAAAVIGLLAALGGEESALREAVGRLVGTWGTAIVVVVLVAATALALARSPSVTGGEEEGR